MDKDQISALFFDRHVTLTQMETRIPWSRKEYQGANNRRDIYYREEELCETAANFAEYFDSGGYISPHGGGHEALGEVGTKFMVATGCWDEE
jgi:hypothetical protein